MTLTTGINNIPRPKRPAGLEPTDRTEAQIKASQRNFALMQVKGMHAIASHHLASLLPPVLVGQMLHLLTEAEGHLRKEATNGTPRK